MRRALGLAALCAAGSASAQSPEPSPYALVAAVLRTDSVQARLEGHPIILDAQLRDLDARPSGGTKLQSHPVLSLLSPDSVRGLGLPEPTGVRTVGALEAASGDTLLVSLGAQAPTKEGREYVVQVRYGSDPLGYRQYGVRLVERDAGWHGQVRWSAEP